MNVVLVEAAELDDAGRGFLAGSDTRTRHIRRILAASSGDVIRGGIVGGVLGRIRLGTVERDGIRYAFEPDHAQPVPPLSTIDLVLGHPRPIVLRRLVRDLTSLGVRRIVVTHTALGERSYYQSNVWNGLRKHLIDGASQAGTTLLPTVERCWSLADAVSVVHGTQVVLHPHDDANTVSDSLSVVPTGTEVTLAIGSERGWTESELEELVRAGFTPANLGTRILRTETACIAAVSILRGRLGFAQ